MNGFNPFKGKLTTQITKKHDTPMTRQLKKGDILAHRIMQKGDPISRFVNNGIAEFTSSVYFHVEIYVGYGWSVTAGQHGVHFSDDIIDRSNFDALRITGSPAESVIETAVLHAYKQVGKPYDYFATLLMPYAGPRAIRRRSANDAWMCSELTAWCYRKAGIDLVPNFANGAEIAPVHIASSQKLEFIGSWYKGEPVPNGELHKPNEFQKEAGCFVRWVMKNIIKPTSHKDEFFAALKDNHDGMTD